MDFDPRDYSDARDPRDRDERDRDHDDEARSLGRGTSSPREDASHDRERDDARHDARDRADHRDRDDNAERAHGQRYITLTQRTFTV